MSLRPRCARWFELLAAREDLTAALETLARTGSIELETHSEARAPVSLEDLQARMEEYNRLARRYHPYWPHSGLRPATVAELPSVILDHALQRLQAWEREAAPLIDELEAIGNERSDLELVERMLVNAQDSSLDFSLLAHGGMLTGARLFVIARGTRLEQLPGALLCRRIGAQEGEDFLLAVGEHRDLDVLETEMAAIKGRTVRLPVFLDGGRHRSLAQVRARMDEIDARSGELRERIEALAAPHQLQEALGDMNRLEWFLTHVSGLPVSANFAWVTGWTSDLDGNRLRQALANADIHAVIHFPAAPRESASPTVMRNPWWAQPFELFARMIGTPSSEEADPSCLLVVLVPLLFGYMFGDVGHGAVLMLAGALLQRRWPVARILIVNGFAAVLFGFVFGSVFGREDLLPALWLHPVEDPLPVLMVPLAGGVVILMLGLVLNAVEAYWRGELRRWWLVEAAVLVLYLSIIAAFFLPGAWLLAAFALVWFLVGSVIATNGRLAALGAAAGTLVESVLQLLINTVSFVRVGAFALAHGGLSLAFNIMAESAHSLVVSALLLLVGNLVVIMLEGLVVTIQTTRLILFEFFIRFMRGSGRIFRPLSAPDSDTGIRRPT
jgi:V/A-type H+-transporting ATPase subunit I